MQPTGQDRFITTFFSLQKARLHAADPNSLSVASHILCWLLPTLRLSPASAFSFRTQPRVSAVETVENVE